MVRIFTLLCILLIESAECFCADKPWDHGKLRVSDNHLYLQHEDGTPFFWLGDTGWLLPQRLDRDEADFYLQNTAKEGFNVVQIQVLNDIPSYNRYGCMSHSAGWDMTKVSNPWEYGYWEHLDYIIDTAEHNGIYIGMVCIWGGLVKGGKMNVEDAVAYGKFLAERYKNHPNIIWITGGDIQGDVKTEVWDALSNTIKEYDPNHLMTFHPRGRTTSAKWFSDRDWLDFHMFQSGHRRYGQRMGNKDYPIPDNTEEDSWMYVDSVRNKIDIKPVLDGEPSYEDIPQGLHSCEEPLWNDKDVRRYAYWSVFAGSAGHTYGHNAIMQFVRPGLPGAYFADGIRKPWYIAIDDPGRKQMKFLKLLMLAFPYFERVADQDIIIGNGDKYDRLIATRGKDYLMVYNHTGRPMEIDLSKISGKEKKIWIMNPSDGSLCFLTKTDKEIFNHEPADRTDLVLIAVDAGKRYLTKDMSELPEKRRDERNNLTE